MKDSSNFLDKNNFISDKTNKFLKPNEDDSRDEINDANNSVEEKYELTLDNENILDEIDLKKIELSDEIERKEIEESDEKDDMASLLLNDGYYKSESQVLSIRSKINNDKEKTTMQDTAKKSYEKLGSKQSASGKNINSLKHEYGLGFSFQRWLRRLAFGGVVLAIIVIVFVSAATAWAVSQYNEAPNISEGNLFNIEESSVVYARDGKTKIFEFFENGKREYLNIEQIPEVMQLAVLALEDQYFYYNQDGIPWSNILGRVVDCVMAAGNNCAGGSGISQQLVKNVQDDRENTTERKVRELFTAIKLYQEGTNQDGKRVNKSDILELYLNWVPFSRNSFGVQAASKAYFGHEINARENAADPNSPLLLNPPKACYLAALVQRQSVFNLSINDPEGERFKEFTERKNACLEKLAGDDKNFSIRGDGKELYIKTQEELEYWKNLKVDFFTPKAEDPYPHFREYVQVEIVKFLNSIGLSEKDLYRRGLNIVTSIDPKIQRETEDVIKGSRPIINQSGGDNASAVVLDGPTGQIVAMVGSLDYFDDSIKGKNNIMLSAQQPGSSIKPYIYAMDFDKGYNPGTIIADTRTTFIDPQVNSQAFQPENYGNSYKGNISIRYALLNSKNIPAIKGALLGSGPGNANIKQGLSNFFNFTENIGLRYSCVEDSVKAKPNCETLPETGPNAQYASRCLAPTFIGACEIDGVTHATALNTLLQEGNLRTASPFISIIDKFGQELYTPDNRNKVYPNQDAKLNPLVAKQIANVMADQNRPEFGQFTRFFNIPNWQLASKTGTTNNNIDTWMVGGSPLYTTVVWAGRTDNKPMRRDTVASNLAAPIWQNIQKKLHADKKPVKFSTDGLIPVRMSGGKIVSSGGYSELLTQDQINIIKEFGTKVTNPKYEPKKENFYKGNNAKIIDSKFKEDPVVEESEENSSSQPSVSVSSSSSGPSSSSLKISTPASSSSTSIKLNGVQIGNTNSNEIEFSKDYILNEFNKNGASIDLNNELLTLTLETLNTDGTTNSYLYKDIKLY
jgi:membrane peptidoglycan carboxypeptidase